MISNTLSSLINARRSIRAFLPTPVSDATLSEIFTCAQAAPSNCNTQPWQTHVLSGRSCETLRARLSNAAAHGRFDTPDFPYDGKYEGIYRDRQFDAAAKLHNAMGIPREDKIGRARSFLRNFAFFDAPHVALVFLPEPFGIREAADCGMYAQTLMLAMAGKGVASCPQTSLSLYPEIVRDTLGIPREHRLLFGISFGYEDKNHNANACRVGRGTLDETVTFHS